MKRVLVTTIAMCTACASASPAPRMLAPDVQIGTMAQRTAFEDAGVERREPARSSRDRDRVDPAKRQRTRRALFWTGIGMASFGAVGFTGFGIGGRVVQRQIEDGYDDGSLTYDDKDRLDRTGQIMNGAAIGSVVIGLFGIGMAAIVYGIDNAKCGELKPRRTACRQVDAPGSAPDPER